MPPGKQATCRVCQATYAEEAYRDLHMGHQHPDTMRPAEAEAYRQADATELAQVRALARHVRGGLATLPVIGFYGLVVLVGIVEGFNPGLVALPFPGVVLICAFLYYLGYIHDQDTKAQSDT